MVDVNLRQVRLKGNGAGLGCLTFDEGTLAGASEAVGRREGLLLAPVLGVGGGFDSDVDGYGL